MFIFLFPFAPLALCCPLRYIERMTITQTVEISANHRTVEVPSEIPAGKVIIAFTPAPETTEILNDCLVCAQNKRKYDPETGNPLYNTKTVAAIEEGMAISRGEIPAKRFSSLKEMLEDLESDDDD